MEAKLELFLKLLLFAILVLTFSNRVYADSFLFVGADFPGIFEKNNEGNLQGLAVDLINQISVNTGHNITMEIYPWSRALYMTEIGQADALIGPYRSIDREKFLTFNEQPLYKDEIFFYSLEENEFNWNGLLSSLPNISIGVTSGWSYGPTFDSFAENLKTYEAETVIANFQRLLVNRIDVIVTHERAANDAIAELDISSKVKKILPSIGFTNGYFAFTKQKNLITFIEEFNAELNLLIENGSHAQFNEKYGLTYNN